MAGGAGGTSSSGGTFTGGTPVVGGASGQFTIVDAGQVKLLAGSPFYDRQQLHRTGYVRSWDPDRLLYGFRKLAGLPQAAGVTAPYAGWDSTTLPGHIAGHYLSAAARLAVATGDTYYSDKVTYMVTELGKCQNSSGYLAAFAEGASGVNAPYYVHHKVLAGLVDAYKYLGNQQALNIASKFAKYFSNRLASTSYAGNSELGAVTDALTELYLYTNDKTLLTLAAKFEDSSFIGPLAANTDSLKGLHGNMHIAFIQGGARYANVTGDASETSASANFWAMVTGHHSYVNGSDSVHEWFQGPNVEAGNLAYSTGETCNTHNMLKITARLIERSPRADLADYFERSLFNHILASVAPDTGRVTYFTPLHGDFRTYLDNTHCDVGTGIESTGRYNEGIYFKGGNSLLVNLYIPSEVNWTERGVVLRQEGYLPVTNTVTFTVTKATAVPATIQFRVPQWVSGSATVTVNSDASQASTKPSSYISVNRTWQTGDVVKVTLPASLRIERAKDQANMVAIFYGPVLLAGRLGSTGMPNDVATSQDTYKSVAPVAVPDIVNASASPADWLTLTDAATLTFKATSSAGPASGITFQPLYAVHHERYSAYWNLRSQ